MWEPVALCCFSRRTGCLILGSLEVIGAILGLLTCVVMLVGWETSQVAICTSFLGNVPTSQCVDILKPIIEIITGVLIVVYLIQLVFASMMIHGIRTKDHCLMTPFLIKNTILIVLAIVGAGVCIALLSVMNFMFMIFFVHANGAIIFMWTYFLLTVRAYYYEMKRGKVEDFHRLVENPNGDSVNKL